MASIVAPLRDRRILDEMRGLLPQTISFVAFNRPRSWAGVKCIVAAEVKHAHSRKPAALRLREIFEVARTIQPRPKLLYRGEFDADFFELLRDYGDPFESYDRLKSPDDAETLEALAGEFGGDLSTYLDELRPVKRGCAVLSRVEQAGLLSPVKQLGKRADRSPSLEEEVRKWPKEKIDSLFDLMPGRGAQFGDSALVRRPSQVCPWINDSTIRSLIVQRRPIKAPLPDFEWYLFLIDFGQARDAPLRNPDEAVLVAYRERIVAYYRNLAAIVDQCRSQQLPRHTFASARGALAGAGELGWRLPEEYVSCVANDEIADVVQRWAEEHKAPDKPFLSVGQIPLTPLEIASEVRNRTRFGAEMRQHIAEYGFGKSMASE